MLGNDLYKLEGISEIGASELKALVLLYKEIISGDVVVLYLSLLYQRKGDFEKLSNLLANLNMSVTEYENKKAKLEKMDLLVTYQKNNQYVFVLNKPLAYEEFFKHTIFGRLLLKKVNQAYFYYLKSLTIINGIDKSSYINISTKAKFDELNDWSKNLEDDYNVIIPKKDFDYKKIDSYFNIEKFMKNISNVLFPYSLRTYENLNEIAKLADTYSINEDEMRIFLKDAIELKPLNFNTKKLNYLCRNKRQSYRDSDKSEGYQIPCTSFLLRLKGGKELVPYDLNIIDTLIHKYHLKPEVVNVLLEYSLKTCDNQLLTKFIYSIAANWYNNDVDNYEKALAQLNKAKVSENKKIYHKKDILPVYDSSNNIEVSNDDIKKYLSKD